MALKAIEDMFPHARRWMLDTPSWNQRNQHFYTKMGYIEVGRVSGQVCYEKLTGLGRALAPGGSRGSRASAMADDPAPIVSHDFDDPSR